MNQVKDTKEFKQRFLEDRDETGRFIVTSQITNKKYFVEPIGFVKTDWGSYNPGTGKIENKKGAGKHQGSINEEDTLITKENGFENITLLGVGVSPMSEISKRDKQYEMEIKGKHKH